MTTTYRRRDLVEMINKLQAARLKWLAVLRSEDPEQPDADVNPNMFMGGVRMVNSQITDLVKQLDAMTTEGHWGAESYELVLEVDLCLDAWADWAFRVNQNSAGVWDHNSSPDAATCWTAFGRVLEKLVERPYPVPEGIATLLDQKDITHLQIARIYGWKTEDGRDDLDRVKREINNPGSEYDPAQWESPEKARKDAKLAEAWKARKVAPISAAAFHKQDGDAVKEEWANPDIAPEPIEQLLKMDGMTVEQVARMKKMTVDEVQAVAGKLHIAIDHSAAIQMLPELADDPRTATSSLDAIQEKIDAQLASDIHTYSEKRNLPKQIIAMLADRDDLHDEEIHILLVKQHPQCSVELVKQTRESFESFEASLAPAAPTNQKPENQEPATEAATEIEENPEETAEEPAEPVTESVTSDQPGPAITAALQDMKRAELLEKAKAFKLTKYSKLSNDKLREIIGNHIAEVSQPA